MKLFKKLNRTLANAFGHHSFLHKISNPFKKEQPTAKTIKVDNSAHYEKLLNKLKDTRATLSIKFESSNEPFVSMVLDVDPKRQFFIIDEINSQLGHRLACMQDPFVISAKENGIFVFFHSHVIDHGSIEGISFYRLAFPSHIEYLQRRLSNRIVVPHDLPMSADFLVPRHGVVKAKICDISHSGIKLMLPRNVKSIFENYAKIEHCRILNPFMGPGEFSLDIKHCTYDLKKQRTYLGCQFSRLDNVGLKFLANLSNHLQLPNSF